MRVAARRTKKVKKKAQLLSGQKMAEMSLCHTGILVLRDRDLSTSQLWCSHGLVSKCQCSLGSDYPVVFEDATCH